MWSNIEIFFWGGGNRTGFLYVALTVLEINLKNRLVSNSEGFPLPLPILGGWDLRYVPLCLATSQVSIEKRGWWSEEEEKDR